MPWLKICLCDLTGSDWICYETYVPVRTAECMSWWVKHTWILHLELLDSQGLLAIVHRMNDRGWGPWSTGKWIASEDWTGASTGTGGATWGTGHTHKSGSEKGHIKGLPQGGMLCSWVCLASFPFLWVSHIYAYMQDKACLNASTTIKFVWILVHHL